MVPDAVLQLPPKGHTGHGMHPCGFTVLENKLPVKAYLAIWFSVSG